MSSDLLIFLHVCIDDSDDAEREMLFDTIFRMKQCIGSSHSIPGEWMFTGYASSDMIVDLAAMSGVRSVDVVDKKA